MILNLKLPYKIYFWTFLKKLKNDTINCIISNGCVLTMLAHCKTPECFQLQSVRISRLRCAINERGLIATASWERCHLLGSIWVGVGCRKLLVKLIKKLSAKSFGVVVEGLEINRRNRRWLCHSASRELALLGYDLRMTLLAMVLWVFLRIYFRLCKWLSLRNLSTFEDWIDPYLPNYSA